jgi:hypothetical protein
MVMCEDITATFTATLTATARSGEGCEASAAANATVSVLSQYNVTIEEQFNSTSFCSPQGPLTFDYRVSSVPFSSNLQLNLGENSAGCSLSRTAGTVDVVVSLVFECVHVGCIEG